MLQHTVLPVVMLEKWKNAVDRGKCVGALMTDLSNAFDCLSHKLLIAKLLTGRNFIWSTTWI